MLAFTASAVIGSERTRAPQALTMALPNRLADGFRRLHRRHHHVGVETPAEAAAQPHLVHHDEVGIDPGGTRRDRAGACRELVAGTPGSMTSMP
jgi:hypothetical protein